MTTSTRGNWSRNPWVRTRWRLRVNRWAGDDVYLDKYAESNGEPPREDTCRDDGRQAGHTHGVLLEGGVLP